MKKVFLKQILRWLVLACIVLLLGRFLIKHQHDFSFLATLHLSLLTPIVLLTIISSILGAYRYSLVIKQIDTTVPFLDIFRHLMVARLLNKLFPQSGIIYRARAFKMENAVSYSRFLASFVAFIWLDLVVTILITTGIVALYQPRLAANGYPLLPFLVLLSLLFFGVTFLSRIIPIRQHLEAAEESGQGFAGPALLRFIHHIGFTFTLARNPRLLLPGGLIIIVNTALSVWRLFYLFQLVGVTANFPELTLFVGLNRIATVIVVTPGNLGIVETLYAVLSEAIGLGAAQGVTVALISRGVGFLVLTTLCGILLLYRRIRNEKVPSG